MKSCQKHDMLSSQDWNEIKRIPSGLDKSWETRRVEGLEMLTTSFELQKEKEKHSRKTAANCCHGNNIINKKNCSLKAHEEVSNLNQNRSGRIKSGTCNNKNNNLMIGEGNCQQVMKCRSLSSSKKNKLSVTSSPHKHERSLTCEIFPGVGGSVVGKNHKVYPSEVAPENFQMKELEEQIIELIHQLAQEKHQARQDKLNLAKLQQELSRMKSEKPMREMLSRQFEQERQRREFLENKLKELNNDCCYCCPNEINVLKKENTRLNEAIQDLLPYKHRAERLQQSNANSVSTLETELNKLKSQLESLDQDNQLMNMEIKKLESIINKCPQCKQQMSGLVKLDSAIHSDATSNNSFKLEKVDDKKLMERIKNLENEKNDLIKENETQFQHYEKCLADVTSQILQALVAQKSLKDECIMLKNKLAQLSAENQNFKSMLNLETYNGSNMNQELDLNYGILRNKHLIKEIMDDKDYEHNVQLTNHFLNKINTDLKTNENDSKVFIDNSINQSESHLHDVSSLNGRLSLTNQGGGEGLAEGKTSSSLSLNEILDDVNKTENSDRGMDNDHNPSCRPPLTNGTSTDCDINESINQSINMTQGDHDDNDDNDDDEVARNLQLSHRNSQHSLTTMSQINFRSVELGDNFDAHHPRCLPRKSRSVNGGLMMKCNETANLPERSKNILNKFMIKNALKINKSHNESIATNYSSFSDNSSFNAVSNNVRSNNNDIASCESSFMFDSKRTDKNSETNRLPVSSRYNYTNSNGEGVNTKVNNYNNIKKRTLKNLSNGEGAKWKSIFPLSCAKPQEEKDDGYLSNKNSEGSYDVAANLSNITQ